VVHRRNEKARMRSEAGHQVTVNRRRPRLSRRQATAGYAVLLQDPGSLRPTIASAADLPSTDDSKPATVARSRVSRMSRQIALFILIVPPIRPDAGAFTVPRGSAVADANG
jgi:hypothetical protein